MRNRKNAAHGFGPPEQNPEYEMAADVRAFTSEALVSLKRIFWEFCPSMPGGPTQEEEEKGL